MKKVLLMALAAFTVITLSQSCKKKMKDEDVAKAATEALTKAGMTGMSVAVKDGVATISGACKDDKCKTDCEAAVKAIAGVKEVKNECTVTPVPTSVATNVSVDAMVQQKIKDGLKDIKGAAVTFEGKKAMFTGNFTASQKTTLQQLCASAGVGADMTKATIK